MEEQKREAVGPFVKDVTEIKPLVHSDEEGEEKWKSESKNGTLIGKTDSELYCGRN